MPEESATEVPKVSQPNIPTGQNMSTEIKRDTGILPYEQRVVDNAIAQINRPKEQPEIQVVQRRVSREEREAARQEGHPIPVQQMAGGAEEVGGLPGQERFRLRPEEERAIAELRAVEALRGTEKYEGLRRSDNAPQLRIIGRDYIEDYEADPEDFDQYAVGAGRKALKNRAGTLNPKFPNEWVEDYKLNEFGYGGQTPKEDLVEMEEALKGYEEGSRERRYLEKILTEIKGKNTQIKEQRGPLSQEQERLAEEFRVRLKIKIAYWFFYRTTAGDFPSMAKNFIEQRYAEINSSEWQTLFSLPATQLDPKTGKEIEGVMALGDLTDTAMRLYALFGVGGGDKGKGRTNEITQQAEEGEWKKAVKKIENVQGDTKAKKILAMLTEEDKKFIEGNKVFCGKLGESQIELVREWVKIKLQKIGANVLDTGTAERWAWEIFHMWGLAAEFDNRTFADKDGYFTPEGYTVSDDSIKGIHFGGWQKRERLASGGKSGPKATFGIYPDRMLTSFLHFLKTGEGENTRSFWEKWFYEGVPLGELPWAQMDTDTLTRDDIKTLLKIDPGKALKDVKDFSQSGTAFRDWNLRLFFLGREGAGLFHIITKGIWKAEELVNNDTPLDISKALNIIVNPAMLTEGEWKEWLEDQNNITAFNAWKDRNARSFEGIKRIYRQVNKKGWGEKAAEPDKPAVLEQKELTMDDYISGVHMVAEERHIQIPGLIDELKLSVKRNIAYGAITSSFENAILREEATMQWGLLRNWAQLGQDKERLAIRVESYIPELLERTGFLDKDEYKEVVKEAEKYLETVGVI